jgi:DNA-binding transcriptional ArsR family regulator
MLKTVPDDHALARASILLAAMANTKRLAILNLLVTREISVKPLAKEIGLSQSALSQHLTKLKEAGVIQYRREGHYIYYSCNSNEVKSMLLTLSVVQQPRRG